MFTFARKSRCIEISSGLPSFYNLDIENMAYYNLFEILDTKPSVHWTNHSGNYAGFFELDGEQFLIAIDTLDVGNKLVANVSFTRNMSMDFVGSQKNPSKIMGAVVNTLSAKLKEIDPDCIVIMVVSEYGEMDSRMHTYGFLARRLAERNHVKFISNWISFDQGHLMILGRKFNPSTSEMEEIIKRIKLK